MVFPWLVRLLELVSLRVFCEGFMGLPRVLLTLN